MRSKDSGPRKTKKKSTGRTLPWPRKRKKAVKATVVANKKPDAPAPAPKAPEPKKEVCLYPGCGENVAIHLGQDEVCVKHIRVE